MSGGLIALNIIICIVAVLLIVIVMLQSSKDDINDAFNGSKTELFKNQKTRGIELFFKRATAVLAILFFVLVVVEILLQKM
jgi:preprotein translocase subunit SecG